jgi:carboxylate-amine ligase
VLDGQEWDALAAGLAQRTRALEAFLRDPQVAVDAGVLPDELVRTSIHRAPEQPPPSVPLGVYGPDVVRDADGRFVVLEDNCRTPTLMGYAAGVRELSIRHLDPPAGLRPYDEQLVPALERVLRAAAPDVPDPVLAVLVDADVVKYEPLRLAGALGVPAVTVDQLELRGDTVRLPDGRPVDVLWRRTSEERLRDDRGEPNAYGRVLLRPLAAGTVRVVDPYGTGVVDDKRTARYVEELVRLHLGEEPLLRTARSYDLGRPDDLAQTADRLDELVLKPRAGSGGRGVVVGPQASPAQLREVLAAVRQDPAGWVAQEVVRLSTCDTWTGSRLEARHVDLRPCVLSDGVTVTVLPGGLTRFAPAAGDLVVNLSQGGGAKDTWVVDA